MTNASPSIDYSEVVLAFRVDTSQKAYLECFKEWERKLQEEPYLTAPEHQKCHILLEAERELRNTGYSPDQCIADTVRFTLEPKLRQLIEHLINPPPKKKKKKTTGEEEDRGDPPKPDELDSFGAPYAKLERKFLFTGRLVGILFQYQDHGKRLLAAHQTGFIDKFEKATSAIKKVTDAIQRDALLQRQMTPKQISLLQDIEKQHADALRMMSELFNDKTQKSLVEDTYLVVQKQFIWTVSFECLRLFGHVSAEVIREFLTLKETNYLARHPAAGRNAESADDSADDSSNHEAERKRFDRIWKGVVPAVKRKTEAQPIRHVIELFNSDPRLARSAPEPH